MANFTSTHTGAVIDAAVTKITATSSSATELNLLDGVTSTTAEINILDGVTSTAAEINILDGVTSTTVEINLLDGVTATTTELNLIDGVTATTAEINYIDGVTSNIQTQLNLKAPLAGASLTGTTSFQNLSDGTITITAFADEDNMASDSATLLATQQSIKAYVDANVNTELIQDLVGAMFTSNTESGITVGYQDGDGTIDLTVTTQSDNNFTTTLKNKLDAIEASATADQSNAEIRTAVEAATDSNVFTDTDHSKLNAIEASATADQTNAEIVAAVEAGSNSNTFTDADHSKLNDIEADADITDTANVTSAGALMDSELTSIANVKALNQSVVSGATPTFTTTNFTDASNKRLMTDAQETKLDSVETDADVTDTANVTSSGALMDSELTDLAGVKGVTISTLQAKPSEGAFANGDKTKLNAIEASADVTDTANVTSAGALMDSELAGLAAVKATTGTFLTADQSKLDGIAASANNYTLPLLDEDAMGSDSATSVASQQSIKAYVNSIVDGAPGTLDTLNELAAALGDDANYAASTSTAIGLRALKSNNLSDLANAGTARSNLGLGALAVLGTVNAATITDNSVGADELNVSGNGSSQQVLSSDGDGTFSWVDNTNTQLSTEQVQDIAGPLVATSGTKTGIAVTYDDINGNMDFVVDHDTATNFVANEHIDWTTDQGVTNIHAGNYTDTNTTYSVGAGGLTQQNFTTTLKTKLDGIEASADVTDSTNVVAALTAGTNVTISAGGTIASTDTNTNTTYLGGTNLTLSGTTFNVDDKFLKNDASDTTSGTITAAGFTTAGNITVSGTVDGRDVASDGSKLDGIASGATANTGDITSVVAGAGLSGGATSGAATLAVTHLPTIDDRDFKPNTTDTNGQVRAYFTTLGGMTGVANSDYQDMLVLDTYSDNSGGDVNALIFDKSTQLIKHYLADQTATTWGTAKTIAYTDSTMAGVWNGTAIASAYLDADTAHLSTTQTFTGLKTFSDSLRITGSTKHLYIDNDAETQSGLWFRDNQDSGQYGKIFFNSNTSTNALDFYIQSSTSVLKLQQAAMTVTGTATIGNISNPALTMMNTATGSGSGPSLIFGHSQGGTTEAARIKSYLVDGSQAGRAGHLDFYTTASGSSVQRMRIHSSGAVGIGVTGDKIHLNQDGTAQWGSAAAHGRLTWDTGQAIIATLGSNLLNLQPVNGQSVVVNNNQGNVDFRVKSDTTNDLIFADAGNVRVGIGTDSPQSILEVKTAKDNINTILSAPLATIGNTTAYLNYQDLEFRNNYSNTTGTAKVRLRHHSNLYVNSGSQFSIATSTTGGTITEALRVDHSQNVGIGTLSPSKKFVVKGASGDQARFEHNGAVGSVDIYSGTDGGLINVRNASGTSIIELDGRSGNLELPYGRITDAGTDMNIVSDNALTLGTESGTALTFPNASLKAVFAGNVSIPVASKLYFGGGNHTYIGEDIDDRLRFFTGGAEFMRFTQQDAAGEIINLYQDIYIPDSTTIHLGAGNDLRLFHDSSNSYVYGYGTGNLYMGHTVADADTILVGDNGSGSPTAYITLDGSISKTTLSKDLRAVDNVKITAGNADDLQLRHDGTNSYIDNGTGMLFIRNTLSNQDIRFTVNDGGVTSNLLTLNAASSRVGIGTTAPADKLHLYGTSGTTQLRIETTANASANIRYKNDQGSFVVGMNSADQFSIWSTILNATTTMTHSNGDLYNYYNYIATVNNKGYSGRDVAGNVTNLIKIDNQDVIRLGDTTHVEQIAISTASQTNAMIFSSSGISMSGNVSMSSPMSCNYGLTINEGGNDSDTRIESVGNANMFRLDASTNRVGIGTGSPSAMLHVAGGSHFTDQMRIVASTDIGLVVHSTDAGSGIAIKDSNTGGDYYNGIFCATNDLFFKSNNVERMRINSSGLVRSVGDFVVGPNNNNSKAFIKARDGYSSATTPDYTWYYNDQCGIYHPAGNTIGFSANGEKMKIGTYGIHSKSSLYIEHGGSDYSPNISFLGGSNTPGSNAYENAGIGYYDNSGTGNMKFFGNRGAMNWHFTDADETLFLMNSAGTLHCEADVVAYSTSVNSDRTLKENINPIPYGLEEVLKMNPVEYDWKEKRNKAHDIGVIAQEIEKIIPEVVQENKDLNSDKMIKSVDYSKMVAVLIKAVQEQQVQINELKTQIGE